MRSQILVALIAPLAVSAASEIFTPGGVLPPYFPCVATGGAASCCQDTFEGIGLNCTVVTPTNITAYKAACGTEEPKCCKYAFGFIAYECRDPYLGDTS